MMLRPVMFAARLPSATATAINASTAAIQWAARNNESVIPTELVLSLSKERGNLK